MKKIITPIIILTVIVLFFTECNKRLDVLPQNNITPAQITTSEDVKAVLFGAYSLLQNSGAFGESYIFAADLLASDGQLDFVGTFPPYRDLAGRNQIADNAVALNMWTNSYTTINTVNTVLDKISLVDDNEKSAIEAEAKFIRGVVYFELVNFFAQPYSAGNTSSNPGVPVSLKPFVLYDPATDNLSRESVESVYMQVLDDLGNAVANLPEQSANFRATKYSALAFRSRVYMAQGNYTQAASDADNVISSGLFSLATTYPQAFNNTTGSTEDVFNIQQTSQSNAGTTNNGLATFYLANQDDNGNLLGGRGDAQVTANFSDLFTGPDDRKDFIYPGNGIGGGTGNFTGKYNAFYKAIPVVRLAEMYLTRGEANYRKGGAPTGGVNPLEDLNIVRRRANANELPAITSGMDFVDERFRELAFEGDRLWTLKRLQLDVGGLPYNDPLLVLPIPQREIDVNKNLTQNPGY